jgi:hypothetical protein
MNCKPHMCAICKEEKYHGAVCITKGYRGMRWICFDCQNKIMEQEKKKEVEGE